MNERSHETIENEDGMSEVKGICVCCERKWIVTVSTLRLKRFRRGRDDLKDLGYIPELLNSGVCSDCIVEIEC